MLNNHLYRNNPIGTSDPEPLNEEWVFTGFYYAGSKIYACGFERKLVTPGHADFHYVADKRLRSG